MGLFSPRKSSTPSTTDKVWKNRTACLKGVAKESWASSKESKVPLVVTFFEEAQRALVEFLAANKIPFREVRSFEEIGRLEKNTLAVIKAQEVNHGSGIHAEIDAAIFVLGHYPIAEVENKTLDALTMHFPGSRISFCLSLDDAFFSAFGSENIRSLMEKLGMDEEECIEHGFVTKAIRNAQEKISKKVLVETKAASEKEWFMKNVRDKD